MFDATKPISNGKTNKVRVEPKLFEDKTNYINQNTFALKKKARVRFQKENEVVVLCQPSSSKRLGFNTK